MEHKGPGRHPSVRQQMVVDAMQEGKSLRTRLARCVLMTRQQLPVEAVQELQGSCAQGHKSVIELQAADRPCSSAHQR